MATSIYTANSSPPFWQRLKKPFSGRDGAKRLFLFVTITPLVIYMAYFTLLSVIWAVGLTMFDYSARRTGGWCVRMAYLPLHRYPAVRTIRYVNLYVQLERLPVAADCANQTGNPHAAHYSKLVLYPKHQSTPPNNGRVRIGVGPGSACLCLLAALDCAWANHDRV